MSDNELAMFVNSWTFTRALTLDMLSELTESELSWSPSASVGSFWKQFRHLGRVQENYMDALDSGSITFTCEGKRYDGGASRKALRNYLTVLDDVLLEKLETADSGDLIDWFGEEVSVREHLARLTSHETLHHGQWIVYCQLLNKPFPKSWSIWGL